ncbi:hypothetical protein RE6C_00259 [Rhodopirellula europaea 6C]|uniref:Uncharacterized protein n=1 Tax=Rhodopirellula europaea 6C TaxID=1263867 RepID=M2BBJ1_9BACT|nr:hypothetical protein RE6C_00259 [Rhodopirellula europaea 6C]
MVDERLQMKSLFQDSFRHVFLVRGEANWFGHCPCRVSWGLAYVGQCPPLVWLIISFALVVGCLAACRVPSFSFLSR